MEPAFLNFVYFVVTIDIFAQLCFTGVGISHLAALKTVHASDPPLSLGIS